ncbi:MAG: serine hydrolase domain-containing protein [Allobranchiibius sp.]
MSVQDHSSSVPGGFDTDRVARLEDHLRGYVESSKLPCYHLRVVRHGALAYDTFGGMRDIEAGAPNSSDTLYRIYSMTKPITSVAAMMLVERGLLRLDDPVATYLPAYADQRVYVGGPAAAPVTRPAAGPMRIRHLLSHTSGLTYGFQRVHPTDEAMRSAGFDIGVPPGMDLAAATDAMAGLPLRFEPGTSWNYSVSTDVLGRVVEVVSGMSLGQFFSAEIFEPLGMHETAFHAVDTGRLARLYHGVPGSGPTPLDALGNAALTPATYQSGGGGLVSSMGDYTRFASMLLGRGQLDGVRLLGNRTVDFMATNHLPGGADLGSFGIPLYAETPFDGVGFGLGFSVMLNPAAAGYPTSKGEYGWGGMASTVFWVDPAEELTVVFMTQQMPSNGYPLRTELRQLVYGALTD